MNKERFLWLKMVAVPNRFFFNFLIFQKKGEKRQKYQKKYQIVKKLGTGSNVDTAYVVGVAVPNRTPFPYCCN